jgi:glucose/mannose-6-phosphate isomerase
MQQQIEDFSKQLRKGLDLGPQLNAVPLMHEIRTVVIAASGSAGIAAHLVESIVFDQLPVPVTILKSYEVPAFVNQHTLFIAISFSGDTEETLAAVNQALHQQAMVGCITSGGKLLQVAQNKGLTQALIPTNITDSRTSLALDFIFLLYLLKAYGLINDSFVEQVKAVAELIDDREETIRKGAKSLAQALVGKLPILYGDSKIYPALVRFQQQLNENARQLAHINVIPEMNHSELTGWLKPETIVSATVLVLPLTDFDHPRVKLRIDICRPVFARKADAVAEVMITYGKSLLEQLLYLIHLFDWASFYLAEFNQVDVLKSEVADYLRAELSKA